MKKIIYAFLLIFSCQLSAQNHPTCDGNRYRDDVFTEVTVTTGIKFGENTTFSGEFQELFMDVYEPTGDDAVMRPVIVLAFGGSFIAGEREDLDFLCEAYAKKGFVAVTIDYRLYDGLLFPIPTAATFTDVTIKAIADIKAAIRFMREDAATTNQFRIDPEFVFSGGISAGSIAAAHAAVIDDTDTFTDEVLEIIENNGGWEGDSSDNFEYSSDVIGYVNFSGALNDADWIDENDPPFISYHDDNDGVVPYGEGFAAVFGFNIIYVEGSQIMSQTADDLGVFNELNTIENSDGHVSYFMDPTTGEETINGSADFLYELICADYVSGVNDEYSELSNFSVSPNPTSGLLILENENISTLSSTLFNAFGQKLGTWENVQSIDLSGFTNGFYFLETSDETEKTKTVNKIILQK